MLDELRTLNDFRLNENLTYRQLGEVTGIPWRTLHALLNSSDPQPFDRTLHQIRRFLEKRKAGRRRRQVA